MTRAKAQPWHSVLRTDANHKNYWYFIPPADIRGKGVMRGQNLGYDTYKAVQSAKKLKTLYERWKGGEEVAPHVIPRGSWQEAADWYRTSPAFLEDITQATRTGYRTGLKAFLSEPCPWQPDITMAHSSLASLTEDRARDLYRGLQRLRLVGDKHRATRLGMANLAMAVGSKVWQAARAKGVVSGDNPLLLVTKQRPVNTRTLWTHDHVRRYVEIGWNRETHWQGRMYPVRSVCMAVALQFDLWQRQGDIFDLKWKDWDGEHFRIIPSKTERKVGHPIYPVPSAWTVGLLDELRRINNPDDEDHIIVNERTGTRYRGPGAMRKIHTGILKLAGLPSDLTLLDLRRSGLNEGTDAGVTPAQGMAQSGHSHQGTFLEIYNQPSKAKTRSVRERVDAYREGK